MYNNNNNNSNRLRRVRLHNSTMKMMMPLLLQLVLLLSSNVQRVQGGVDFNVDYYTCDGDFLTIENLELSCPSGSCGLGKDVVLTGTLEDTTSQLPNYVNLDVKVSIENYMSAKLYSGSYLSLCDYITPTDIDEETGESSYKCPNAGSYTFELQYTIPSDSSTLWWSSGNELHVKLVLKSMVSTSTTCDIAIYPSSMSASSFIVWAGAGLMFVAIAGCIACRERLLRTCSYECTPGPQPGDPGYDPSAYYVSDDAIHRDYYRSSKGRNLEMI